MPGLLQHVFFWQDSKYTLTGFQPVASIAQNPLQIERVFLTLVMTLQRI